MNALYNIFLSLYFFGIKISAFLGNDKAKKWLKGRKNLIEEIRASLAGRSGDRIWFHVASLGEYEMGKPLMKALKNDNLDILLTFYSPSGYEHRKENEITDLVFYLPFDRKSNVNLFLDLVHPKMAFFVKNEFWMNYLFELKDRQIPTYLISGIFRTNHPFFQYYGGFFRRGLQAFDHLFVQNRTSEKLLKSFNFENVSVVGDLRIDRTAENALNFEPLPSLDDFARGKPVVVLGSSWEKEEALMAEYLDRYPDKIKVIIAPHDISDSRISSIQKLFKGAHLFSRFDKEQAEHLDVLIVDSIGKLMSIYHYGDVAFVGGAWGSGLHNILEPAAFGLPIIFGPLIHKFPEAYDLIETGGAFSVSKYKDFEKVLTRLIVESSSGNESGQKSKQYIRDRVGVTEKIKAQLKI